MSTFSIPDSFMSRMDQLKKMNEDTAALMPREFAGAVNLMAHPLAGVATFSALGFGAASHAFGLWLGAAEAWQRVLTPMLDDLAPSASDFAERREPPAARAKAAAEALIADAKVAAKEIAEPVPAEVEPVAREVAETAIETVVAAPELAEPVPAVVEPIAREVGETAIETVVAAPELEAPAKDLLPEDFRQPRAIDKPEAPDNLKLISGIGPKLEQVLHGLGVWTFAQVAEWSREEIAWVDDYLGFKGRIGRDGWIEQAATLANRAAEPALQIPSGETQE